MAKENLQSTLQNLIQNEGTIEAINWLKTQPLSTLQSKGLAIIAAEFNTLQQAERKGTLPFETVQMRTNQINDRLLSLLSSKPNITAPNKANLLKILLPIALFLGSLFFWFQKQNETYNCPAYPNDINTKVLILPFENVGNQDAKPQVILRDRINQLTTKNSLSTKAQLGNTNDNLDPITLANTCSVNAVIWGTYSSKSDSLRLVLQYAFLDKPDWNNSGELMVMKDVTSIQNGQMLKDLDDSIMSLCAVIALRKGNKALAKKWLNKIKKLEHVDKELLALLE